MPRGNSRAYTTRHFQDVAALLAAERDEHGASPALNRLTAAFTTLFAEDSKRAGSKPPYIFDPVLFGEAARGHKPVTARPARRGAARQAPARNEGWGMALRAREAFSDGYLTGEAVQPHNQTGEYRAWAKGSVGRVLAGALNEHGTAGVISGGGSSPMPALGLLDFAPAMAMALNEAAYIVRSHGTVIAWWLGPEVYGAGDEGKWILVSEACNDEYGWFDSAIAEDQARVKAAVTVTS